MSSRAVTTTIVGGRGRSARAVRTSKPLTPGRPRSSSMTSMLSAVAAIAPGASCAVVTSKPSPPRNFSSVRGIERSSPTNGQVRAVPDERTIRSYGTLGLLDGPAAMRGRTALYGARHLAQVVAIKRLQTAGRSLAGIQEPWPRLHDAPRARMTGVVLAGARKSPARPDFWKREPVRQRDQV